MKNVYLYSSEVVKQNEKPNEQIALMLKEAKKKRMRKKTTINAISYLLYSLLALFFLFPFIFMLSKSLMTAQDASSLPIRLFPTKIYWGNYAKLFLEETPYLRYFLNTLYIVLFNMIAIPLSASFVAYGFAKTEFLGKNALFVVMLSTIMLPSMVLQIPQYVLFASFGWLNSFKPMTIPNLFGGGAMNIFLLRQFMRGLPKELDNAAKIDGANALQRYFLIILPLCTPILIYVMINVFNSYWSDFFGPLLYLRDSSKYTLAIGIFQDSITNSDISYIPVRMAAGTFMTIFPAILFFIFQKQLIEGVTVGSIKG